MRNAVAVLALIVLVAGLHQLARHYAFDLVNDAGSAVPVTGFFNIVEVWNTGVSFGMFHSVAYGQWLLSALALSISLALMVWLARAGNGYRAWAAGLIIGGALGNTIDRIRYGAVADYLDFHINGVHWPAFNVTDMAICLGVALLVFEKPLRGRDSLKKMKVSHVREA